MYKDVISKSDIQIVPAARIGRSVRIDFQAIQAQLEKQEK